MSLRPLSPDQQPSESALWGSGEVPGAGACSLQTRDGNTERRSRPGSHSVSPSAPGRHARGERVDLQDPHHTRDPESSRPWLPCTRPRCHLPRGHITPCPSRPASSKRWPTGTLQVLRLGGGAPKQGGLTQHPRSGQDSETGDSGFEERQPARPCGPPCPAPGPLPEMALRPPAPPAPGPLHLAAGGPGERG